VDHLEPLPDIEFNIRTGNTLVGFATFEDVKQVLQTDLIKQKELPKIQERAEIVDRAFKQFRQQQTELGGEVTVEHKEELRRRLTDLENELNRYLATEYGIYPEKKPKDYKRWLDTHKPFHWFVDFYGILESGGFDVIIGNPPYVELRTITGYQKMEYSCESTGNIYALVIERCYSLVHSSGHQGFIVPVSSVSTDRYYALQQLLSSRELWYCSFDDRPSRLFDGLEHIRLTIHLIGHELSNPYFFSTRYNKWNAEEREVLFDQLQLSSSCQALVRNSLPKITSEIEISIINKLVDQQLCLSSFYAHDDKYRVFYSRKVGYFLQVLDFEPKVLDGTGQRRPPSEFKELKFSNKELAQLALCCRATYEIFP